MRWVLAVVFFCRCLTASAQDTVRVSLLFTGDIMQHESQMKAARNPVTDTYEYTSSFELVSPLLSAPDITIGNLELTLAGKPYTGYPQFSAPDELLSAIKEAGFDVLVTANNHSADRGRHGLERTIDKLDSLGILHTGTFKDTLDWLNNHPLILERKGLRVSLLNYTYGTNGMPVAAPNRVNSIDTAQIVRDLQRASRQHTDAVIVFFHWGMEYIREPNAEQVALAELCLRHGARFVIGSHPHVIQRMEWRREQGQVIVYSLGNFISAQRPRYRNGGAVLHLDLQKITYPNGTSNTSIHDASFSLIWVNRATDARRTYQLVPVTGTGVDSLVVQSPVMRTQMSEFILDSRSFLEQQNKGIIERRLPRQPKRN